MAKMMTSVELLSKHMLGTGAKSMNAIGAHGISSLEKEAAYA